MKLTLIIILSAVIGIAATRIESPKGREARLSNRVVANPPPLPSAEVTRSISRPPTPAATNFDRDLPAFKYPPGASTSWWSLLQRSNGSAWITIASNFYGVPTGTYTNVVKGRAVYEYRMRKQPGELK